MRKFVSGLALSLAALGTALSAQAASINVLFYGAGTGFNSAMSTLSATAHTYDPAGDGSNTWTASFWNAGSPTPDFSAYDVLFIGAGSPFGLGMDATRLLGAKSAIEAARGSRTFLTGQDADWHYMNTPGARDDGPRGFIINAINWAASGTGLGIVSMADGWEGSGSTWWTHANSFLRNELVGTTQYFQSESVQLGTGQASFPINEGLTSAGLSNWGTSSHAGFNNTVAGYASINFEGADSTGRAITIVTQGEEDGGTQPGGGTVPVPSSLLLVGVALLAGRVVLKKRQA